jgi:hypothetical protein
MALVTVDIPDRLLQQVDARARALGISRSRFVIFALQKTIAACSEWPPELVEALSTPLDAKTAALAFEMERSFLRSRPSPKRRPRS